MTRSRRAGNQYELLLMWWLCTESHGSWQEGVLVDIKWLEVGSVPGSGSAHEKTQSTLLEMITM